MSNQITRFHAKNCRSCLDVTLEDLGQITAFVGRNGVGKSNILKAIESVVRKATEGFSHAAQFTSKYAEIEFRVNRRVYRYVQKLELRTIEEKRRFLHIEESLDIELRKTSWKNLISREQDKMKVDGRVEPIQIAAQVPCLQAVFSLFPQSHGLARHVNSIISFLDSVRYFPLDELSTPAEPSDAFAVISEKTYQSWLATIDSPSCDLDSVCLQILHLWHADKPALDELLSLLGDSGIGLIAGIDVQTFSLNREDKSKETHFYLSFKLCKQSGASNQNAYQFSDLSVGTRRIIRLLVIVLTGKTTVALIEHPEDAIHAGMVRKLMDILRVNADRRQMLIASHSPQVLNILTPDQVRFVWMESGGTKVRSLTNVELAAAADFICKDGPLSDFLESLQDN